MFISRYKKLYYFKTKVLILLVGVGIFLGCFQLNAGCQEKPENFNVILIVIDALRPDHLNCYGYQRKTSPNIDKLASKGVLFTQAFAQSSRTTTSMPSMFTSLYPSVHKVFTGQDMLAEEFTTLAEILKDNGYTTYGYAGNPHLKTHYNWHQGFDLYDDVLEELNDKTLPPHLRFETIKRIHKKAFAQLRAESKKPFFLFLHYRDVHEPYVPPFPYNLIFRRALFLNHKKYTISQYDGEIRYVDDQIGVLLNRLKKMGLLNNTLLILTSDHGDEFWEHGGIGHGQSLYDELIHVPLIINLPRVIPEGKVINNLVRHIDLIPTILGVLNISSNNIMHGVSLSALIRGERIFNLDVYGEVMFDKEHLIAIRTDKWKFITRYDTKNNIEHYELYNLEDDPQELTNVYGKRPEIAKNFKKKLYHWRQLCQKDRREYEEKGVTNRKVKLDEETREQLRSLGYLQ